MTSTPDSLFNLSLKNRIKELFLGVRPWSFPMTAVSVTAGSVYALQGRDFNPGIYLLTLTCLICFHGGTNLLNDYFDHRRGLDTPDSPTAKYRPHLLLENKLSPTQHLLFAFLFYGIAAGVGIYFVILRGLILLPFGLAGAFLSFFYSGGRFAYKGRGLGEIAVFLVWGPMMVGVSHYLQTSTLSLEVLLLSIPLGTLVAAVLTANNIRDLAYDRKKNTTTFPVLLGGRKNSKYFFVFLIAAPYLTVTALILGGLISPWSSTVFVTLPLAVRLLIKFRKRIPDNADSETAMLNLFFGLLLIGSFAINSFTGIG